ncbi:hypothetical protein ACQI4L_28540 [Mycolicibacterium litorale]|uniref:hypothetical protein n=1 Tax=Mycolicibacterium litorale TaxID=758802 RepID=UPI003CF13F90
MDLTHFVGEAYSLGPGVIVASASYCVWHLLIASDDLVCIGEYASQPGSILLKTLSPSQPDVEGSRQERRKDRTSQD